MAWCRGTTPGRGAVICTLNRRLGTDYPTYFVPRSRLLPLLRAWLVTPAMPLLSHQCWLAHFLQVVDHYDPTREVVLFLEAGAQAFTCKTCRCRPPSAMPNWRAGERNFI